MSVGDDVSNSFMRKTLTIIKQWVVVQSSKHHAHTDLVLKNEKKEYFSVMDFSIESKKGRDARRKT